MFIKVLQLVTQLCQRFGKWAAGHLNDLNPSVPFRFELMDHRRMA
ncbi:hypothetical protein HanRHA438_Chr05g0240781 [Helianthus annuus]|nr:hypothetical protein HanRHA438_Chr05g0240781 [Helianthus annuus]